MQASLDRCSSTSSRQVPFSKQMNGPSLKCQMKGIPSLALSFVSERHRLPIEQRVDHIGLELTHALAPIAVRNVLDMAKRQRPHRVVPRGLAHPQPEQPMPAFLQRKHPIGVIGQLTDQQDVQSVFGARCFGAHPHLGVQLRFIDWVAYASVETQWMLDRETLAK